MSDAAAASPRAGFVGRWIRDWFLLEGPERQIRSLSPERQSLVRRYHQAGTRRVIIADEMIDDTGLVPALVLYRDAAGLLAAAVITAADPSATPDTSLDGSWRALAALAGSGRIPAPPAALAEARAILSASDPTTFDDATPETLRTWHTTVKDGLRWLRDLVEPRTLQEIRVNRGLRLAICAGVVLFVLWRSVATLFAPTNIALHKKVTISARFPLSVAPIDNSGLVNGELEPDYGIHTAVGAAWVMIDLGAVHPIREIVVHNRQDGAYDEGMPFFLELSVDGTHFTELARRTEHFSASDPWIAPGQGRPARYLRIRSDHYVTLTEVEVHEGQ
jgi:hypothetical protein